MPPSRAVAELIRVVTATLTARAEMLDGPGLRALVVDVKLNGAYGAYRLVDVMYVTSTAVVGHLFQYNGRVAFCFPPELCLCS
jgi:hypothetical protein